MIKKIGMSVVICLIFSFVVLAGEIKIGYVDLRKVLTEYEKTKVYETILEKKKEEKEKQLDEKREEIKKMQEKLDLLKKEEKDKKRQEVDKAAREYRQMERETILNLRKERDEKMREILDDINKTIQSYAAEKGFDLIIEKSATLYGAKNLDITEKILKIINTQYKKKKK